MDHSNIVTKKFGCTIHDPRMADEHLKWCDVALVAGATIGNWIIDPCTVYKAMVSYSVTISGAVTLLSPKHLCYFVHPEDS